MDIETIRQQLERNTGRFPAEAVRAAIEQREAMTPVLLAVLQELADASENPEHEPSGMLHLYAMYLLAQFREQAAYAPLVKFCSMPGEICYELIGDVLTEDLNRILASVCHNDLGPIERMIEDPQVNEYVRSACLRALTVLVVEERVPREQVVDYFHSLFNGKLEREPDFIWSALVSAACDIYPEELLNDIQRAYDDDLVDLFYIGMDSISETLAKSKDEILEQLRQHRGCFIEDTAAEMSRWANFTQSAAAMNAERQAIANQLAAKGKKIGRNEPCPCGSGKKYKKCCLH